jgi:hypothetical protein
LGGHERPKVGALIAFGQRHPLHGVDPARRASSAKTMLLLSRHWGFDLS